MGKGDFINTFRSDLASKGLMVRFLDLEVIPEFNINFFPETPVYSVV